MTTAPSHFPYVCQYYYRIVDGKEVTLKHYIVMPAHEPLKEITYPIMVLSDWRNDLTFLELNKKRKKDAKVPPMSEDYVYLRAVVEEVNGCMHYPLNCRVICASCNKESCCRFCHDDSLDLNCEQFDRFALTTMRCLFCNKKGPIGLRCKHCNAEVAKSFCPQCKYISMISSEVKPFFHCDACTFCRVGNKENYIHCYTCKQCYKKECFDAHRCDASNYVCCVCHDELKSSIYEHFELSCNRKHYIHVKCFDSMIRNSNYICPLCRRYVINEKMLKLLTEDYTIFYLIFMFLMKYVTCVPDDSPVVDEDADNKVETDVAPDSGEDTEAELETETERESESDSAGDSSYSSSDGDLGEGVNDDQNAEADNPGRDNDNNPDMRDQDVNAPENPGVIDISSQISPFIDHHLERFREMKVVKFVIQKDTFLSCTRTPAKCRECGKDFAMPQVQALPVPCVHCRLFNIDVLTPSDASSMPNDDEFYEVWRGYIEGYRLNVEKNIKTIRRTFSTLLRSLIIRIQLDLDL